MTPASFLPEHQSSVCAGAWKLAGHKAMSLRPRRHGVLRVVRGRLWVTTGGEPGRSPGESGDHVLSAGEQLRLPAWRHVVIESWKDEQACFDWQPLPELALAAAARCQAVLQPLSELRQAAGLAAGALGRLVVGLGRLAWGALAPGHNAPALSSAPWLAPSPNSTTSSATRSWT